MKTFVRLFFSGVAAPFLAAVCGGCMSFDYVGQKFPAHSESSPVAFFEGRGQIPPDTYRIIGRGTLTGPESTDDYDRRVKLRALAREHGADALCIISRSRTFVGTYPRAAGEFAPPVAAKANPDNLGGRGEAWKADSFGQSEVASVGERRGRYNFGIRVLLLKKNADFEAEMKKRTGSR